MKRTFSLIIIVCWVFAACQSTPDEITVKQKDGKALMDTIEGSEKKQEEKVPYKAENEWIETLKSETGQFSCVIDSSIETPKMGIFPVVYVKPNQFTVDFIKNSVYQLVPDEISLNIYDGGNFGKHTLTKEQIDGAILSIQETINDPNSFLNRLKDEDPEAYEERLAIELEALENYMSKYESAPDEITVESLIITDDLIKNTFVATNIPPAVENPMDYAGIPRITLTVADCDDAGGIYNKVGLTITKEIGDIDNSISNNEAIDISNNIISKLNIDDMNICAIVEPNKYNKYLTIYFSRDYEGVPTTYTTNQISLDSDAGTYSFPWLCERIEIKLYPDGDLASFKYTSPLTETEIVSNNVTLLNYTEIQDVFCKYIVYEGIYVEDDYVTKREYYVNKIVLGMMRVAVQNEVNKYMVIPVWDFYGYYVDTYDSQKHTQWQLDENNKVMFNNEDQYYSILTINAIDGSVIDRSLGY